MAETNDDVIPVTSVPQFAAMIAFWHGGVTDKIDNLMEIPEGTTVTVEEEGVERELVLTGDVLLGFQAALLTVKSEFTLPFHMSADDAPDTPATGQ